MFTLKNEQMPSAISTDWSHLSGELLHNLYFVCESSMSWTIP